MKRFEKLTAFVVATVMLSFGRYTMAEEVNLWVLDETPISKDRPIMELELLSVQKTMGGGGKRETVEGRVSLAEPLIYAPPGGVGSTAPEASHTYYIAYFFLTLHSLSGGRKYNRLELRVKLEDSSVTSYMMIPHQVLSKKDIENTINISAVFEKLGVKLGGDVSYAVQTAKRLPTVLSFGLGKPEFYWEFKEQDNAPPLIGSQRMLVILRTPISTSTVKAEIYAEALIEGRIPWIKQKRICSDRKESNWDLAKAEPFDTIPFTRTMIDNLPGMP